MQFLRPAELKAGFWAIDDRRLVPELIDFGQGWAHSGLKLHPHVHRHWELYFQVEGETEWAIMGQKMFNLQSGSLYWMGPNINHWMMRSSESNRYMFVGLDLRPIRKRVPELAEAALDGCRQVQGVNELEPYFSEVLREGTTERSYQGVGLRLAVDTLVLNVVRLFGAARETHSTLPTHPAVGRAMQLLSSRFREPWTLDRLARQVGVSRGRLAALFSAETGSTIHRVLLKRRIAAAEGLLQQSDLSVSEIALACGFQTGEHFARVFRSHHGYSPRDFRTRALSAAH